MTRKVRNAMKMEKGGHQPRTVPPGVGKGEEMDSLLAPQGRDAAALLRP